MYRAGNNGLTVTPGRQHICLGRTQSLNGKVGGRCPGGPWQSPSPAAQPGGPLDQSQRTRSGAASGRAGKIITEEAREGGGEAGERGLMKLLTR